MQNKNLAGKISSVASKIVIATLLVQNFALGIPATNAATQNAYRWRNDDGTESTASFNGAENTPLVGLPQNTTTRVRFGEANSGTESELLKKASGALLSGDGNVGSGVIDTVNGYAYFGTDTNPGHVVKVALGTGNSAPSRVGSVTMIGACNYFEDSAVIDVANGYAYFGDQCGHVTKIDLGVGNAAPSIVGVVETDPTFEFELESAVIDTANGYAYFGSDGWDTAGSFVYKIALGVGNAAPTNSGSVTLNSGETGLFGGAVIDPTNGFAYFGTNTSPAIVVKIALGSGPSAPTRVSALTLNSGENDLWTAVGDVANGYAYFGTLTSPGRVVKVDITGGTPARVGAVTLNSGENDLYSSVIDTTNGFAYFGADVNPAIIVKVALGSGSTPPSRVDSVTMGSGEGGAEHDLVFDPTHGYIYFSAWASTPDTIEKISIAPKAQFRLEYGAKVSTCSAIASWTQVPTTATSEHFQMSDSTNITDGEATTDSAGLTNGNTSFVPGEAHDVTSETSEISYGENQFTELEYSIEATTNSTPGGDYCLRLTDDGTPTAFTYTNYAEVSIAGGGGGNNNATLFNRVLQSRLKAGVASDDTVFFHLPDAHDGNVTTVTFPAGFTVNSDPTSLGSSSCFDTFGHTSNTVFATKTACGGATDLFLGGFNVTNPGTPGTYQVTWVNDDPGGADIYITSEDTISMSATVDPNITFDVGAQTATCDGSFASSVYTVAFGSLSPSTVSYSDVGGVQHVCTKLSTNAASGAIVTVMNANGASGLKSASVPGDVIPSASASMSSGVANYGLCATSVSGLDTTTPTGATPTNGSFSASSCGTGTATIVAFDGTTQTAWTAAGPVSNGFYQFDLNAEASATTPAHSDYADTLTWIATGTF